MECPAWSESNKTEKKHNLQKLGIWHRAAVLISQAINIISNRNNNNENKNKKDKKKKTKKKNKENKNLKQKNKMKSLKQKNKNFGTG